MEQPRWRYHCAVDECSTHLTCSEHSGVEIFLKSSTMAHAGETHLFLEKFFDLQSPSWPRRNPRQKTQAWIKCAGDTPNSNNWNHSRILKCKNPLFIFQTKYNLPLTDLTQKLSQPVLDLPQKPSQTLAFRRFSPFWTSTNSLTPFWNFSPHWFHTISHWAMIMMRKMWAQTYTAKSCPETTRENYRNSRHPLCLPLTLC